MFLLVKWIIPLDLHKRLLISHLSTYVQCFLLSQSAGLSPINKEKHQNRPHVFQHAGGGW